MTTKEVLEKAKDLLLVKGWGQGFSSRRETLCLGEALARPFQEADDELYNKVKDLIALEIGDASQDIFMRPAITSIVHWNDSPGRTKQEVIALLDKAIEKVD